MLHNTYIVDEMYFEVTACIIKCVIIITETLVMPPHTEQTPFNHAESRESSRRSVISQACCVCLTIDAAWGFSLDVIGKDARGAFTLQLLMLLRRLAGVSFQTCAVNELSPYRGTF